MQTRQVQDRFSEVISAPAHSRACGVCHRAQYESRGPHPPTPPPPFSSQMCRGDPLPVELTVLLLFSSSVLPVVYAMCDTLCYKCILSNMWWPGPTRPPGAVWTCVGHQIQRVAVPVFKYKAKQKQLLFVGLISIRQMPPGPARVRCNHVGLCVWGG